MIVMLVPASKCYMVAFRLSTILALLLGWTSLPQKGWPFSKDVTAIVLRSLLINMSCHGKKFPLDMKVEGLTLSDIRDVYSVHNRLLLCSVHLPLNRLILRVLHDLAIPIAVVKYPWDGKGWVWGESGEVESINVSPSVLLNVKGKLSENHAVVTILDNPRKTKDSVHILKHSGGTLYVSRNIFKLAMITRTPVIFFIGSRDNQRLKIATCRTSMPYFRNEADVDTGVDEFVHFIRRELTKNHGWN